MHKNARAAMRVARKALMCLTVDGFIMIGGNSIKKLHMWQCAAACCRESKEFVPFIVFCFP
jgi:hypothetical protein